MTKWGGNGRILAVLLNQEVKNQPKRKEVASRVSKLFGKMFNGNVLQKLGEKTMKKWVMAFVVSWFLVANLYAQESPVPSSELRSLAKQIQSPEFKGNGSLAKKKGTDLSEKLATLTPQEAFEVRKISREKYWPKRFIKKADKEKLFSTLEKIDEVLFQEIEINFGVGATIYNVPFEEVLKLTDEVFKDEEVKNLLQEVEKSFHGENCQMCSVYGYGYKTELGKSALYLGGSCDYVADWPKFVTAELPKAKKYRKGYKCDRVKNSPNEGICDFRIHIDPKNYNRVSGLSPAAYCAVKFHGGLSASENRDRFIVGYGSVIACLGIPSEWWVKSSVIFREK